MPRAKGEELRWLVVFKRVVEGTPIGSVAAECRMSQTFVKSMVTIFEQTGAVESHQGARAAPPANQVMTDDASHELLRRVLASPQTTRTEHRLRLMIDGVVESVHVSTVCRACRQLRLSSKKLCHYQARRDEVLARTFVEGVVNDVEARMHLLVDETAKDGREFRRRGIAPLGAPAICSVGYFGGSFGLHSRKRLSSTSCPHVLSVKQSSVSCQRCGVLKDQSYTNSPFTA